MLKELMKNWHGHFLLAATLSCLVWASGCGKGGEQSGGAAADTEIKVGEFASLTGKEASFGQSSHKGTALAIDQINSAGGVLGKKINLITEDDLSKPGESATIVKKFISQDHVVAVLGEVASSRSIEAARISQDNKVPQISPASTNPKVTETGDYIFRACFTDPFQGKLLAEFGLTTLKAKHIAVLTDVGSAYSVGLADYFKQAFTTEGGTVIGEQKYNSGDKDFKAQLTAIKAMNPEAIFVPGYYTEVGLIVLQARQLGITVPMFGGDGWEGAGLIETAGDALTNTYYSTHFSPIKDTPEVQNFVKAYQAKYGGETPDAMAALGYDSALILVDALKRAGTTDSAKLRDAIAATDITGATGHTKLDAHRDAPKAAVIITVENGKFKFLRDVQP